MKASYTLTQQELHEAVAEYVAKRHPAEQGKVSTVHWSATEEDRFPGSHHITATCSFEPRPPPPGLRWEP